MAVRSACQLELEPELVRLGSQAERAIPGIRACWPRLSPAPPCPGLLWALAVKEQGTPEAESALMYPHCAFFKGGHIPTLL